MSHPAPHVSGRSRARLAGAAAVLLLLGLACAFLALRERPAPGDGMDLPAPDAGPAAAEPVAGRAADDGAGAPAREQLPIEQLAAAVASSSRPATGPFLIVRVLDAASRQPAPTVWPGTEVAILAAAPDWSALSAQDRAAMRDLTDWERLTRRLGTRHACDAHGEARLPVPKRTLLLCARAGDAYAEAFVPAGSDGPVELMLEPDLCARVRVVDPRGAPVLDMPVFLRDPTTGKDPAGNLVRSRTDAPDGVATFAHLQCLARQAGKKALAGTTVVACAAAPGIAAVSAPFEWRRAPVVPVEIRIADTGAIEVVVVEADRERVDRRTQAGLREPGEQFASQWTTIDPATGLGRFAHVGLGTKVAVALYSDDVLVPEKETLGPTRAGEVVRVEIEVTRLLPSLSGRAVDAAGQALVDRELSVSWRTSRGRGEEKCKTGTDGQFSLLLDRDMLGATLVLVHVGTRGGTEPLLARLATQRTIVRGPLDLGTLVLALPPLLVAGEVVDERGTPVAEARCELVVATGAASSRPGWVKLPPDGLTTRSKAPGRFEFRGQAPAIELRLSVAHGEFLAQEPVAFARGQDDLRVVLTRGGLLVARVLCERGSELPPVRLGLRPSAAPVAPAERAADTLPFDIGRNAPALEYRWRGLAPGTWTLTVWVRPDPDPVLVIGGIVVTAGEATRDARLLAIDLTSALRRIEVAVVDAEGRPVAGPGSVRIVSASTLPGRGTLLANGKATLALHRPTVDLLVHAMGYFDKRVADVGSDTRVVLERGREVRVTLAGLPDDGASRFECSLGAEYEADYDPRADFDMQLPDFVGKIGRIAANGTRDARSGAFVFAAGETGTFSVSVQAAAEPGRRPGRTVVAGKIVVADTPAAQAFTLSLSAAALADLLAGAR